MIGVELLFVSVTMILMPLVQIWRKFGELSDETLARFVAEMTLEQRIKLAVSISLGVAMFQFGMFMLTRPR